MKLYWLGSQINPKILPFAILHLTFTFYKWRATNAQIVSAWHFKNTAIVHRSKFLPKLCPSLIRTSYPCMFSIISYAHCYFKVFVVFSNDQFYWLRVHTCMLEASCCDGFQYNLTKPHLSCRSCTKQTVNQTKWAQFHILQRLAVFGTSKPCTRLWIDASSNAHSLKTKHIPSLKSGTKSSVFNFNHCSTSEVTCKQRYQKLIQYSKNTWHT